MKFDKADMPKVIILGVLVAVFIGWGVYSMVGRKASASSPPSPSVREAAANDPAAAKAKTPSPVVKPEPPVQVAMAPAAEPAPSKDPFSPRVCEAAPCSMVPPRIPMMRGTNMASLPPFRPGISIRPIGGPAPFAAAPEADPQFTLTGVINGATNVAIIRAGESERHIVTEGQYINGRYFVKFIGHDRVVLMHGTRSISLRLGGGTNG